jgi:hypothetical protein
MKAGDEVTVVDVYDNKLIREIVAIEHEYVYVARPEEVRKAREEGRDPACIGFRKSDVVHR